MKNQLEESGKLWS